MWECVLGLCGNVLLGMEMRGNAWESAGMCAGIVWECVIRCGNAWESVGMCVGIVWECVISFGKVWECVLGLCGNVCWDCVGMCY